MNAPQPRREDENVNSNDAADNNHGSTDPAPASGIPEGSKEPTVPPILGIQGVEGTGEPEFDAESTQRDGEAVRESDSSPRRPAPQIVGKNVFPTAWLRAKARELDTLGISALLTHSEKEMLELIWHYSWGEGRISASVRRQQFEDEKSICFFSQKAARRSLKEKGLISYESGTVSAPEFPQGKAAVYTPTTNLVAVAKRLDSEQRLHKNCTESLLSKLAENSAQRS